MSFVISALVLWVVLGVIAWRHAQALTACRVDLQPGDPWYKGESWMSQLNAGRRRNYNAEGQSKLRGLIALGLVNLIAAAMFALALGRLLFVDAR